MAWNVLVAYDFTDGADRALEWAVELTRSRGDILTLLNVIPATDPHGVPVAMLPIMVGSESVPDARKAAEAELQLLADERCPGASSEVSVGASAPDAIVQRADELGADLIVIGSHGRGALARAILGSVAGSVVQNAHCPVTVVRPRRTK